MPLYTKQEFAELCGMNDAAQVRVAINRDKKVVADGDMIDSEHPVNKVFYERRKVLLAKKEVKGNSVPKQEIKEPTQVKTKKRRAATNVAKDSKEEYGYAKELEQLKVKVQQLEVAKREIDIEKKRGDALPVVLFQSLIRQYSQSNTKSFQTALERVVNRFSVKYKMSAADQAEMRKIVISDINKALELSHNEVKDKIKNIIAEYSMTRERGERGE